MGPFLRLKGINWWLLASAVGLNFIWSTLMLVGFAFLLDEGEGMQGALQLAMLAACFILSFFCAWLIATMAADGLGPNYGIYGSLGAAVPLLLVVGPSGIFGLLLVVTTLLGGLNGGLLVLRRQGRGKIE